MSLKSAIVEEHPNFFTRTLFYLACLDVFTEQLNGRPIPLNGIGRVPPNVFRVITERLAG